MFSFSDNGWADYLYWQNQDRKTLKKINNLLESIDRDGALAGLGKPERLKHTENEQYSRRIDEKNRLVYRIDGERIIVDGCKGHYED